MKKALIILSVGLLIGIGYFTYLHWFRHSDLTHWSFVPADAAIVAEVQFTQDVDSLKEYPIWQVLKDADVLHGLDASIQFLDSINGADGFLSVFEDLPLFVTAHRVSNTDLGFLFIGEVQNISQNGFVSSAISRIKELGGRSRSRNYNGYTISEISQNGRTLTYIFYQNFLLASFTPYLVEDAIRTLDHAETGGFEQTFQPITTSTQGLFKLHINYEALGKAMSAFTQSELTLPLHSGSYDAIIDSSFIQFSGISTARGTAISTHSGQASVFDMAEVVPIKTAYFYHFSAQNMEPWKDKQLAYLRKSNPELVTYSKSLKEAYDFSVDQVFDLLDEEIGLALLESPQVSRKNRLMIMEVSDTEEALQFLNGLNERISRAKGDTIYSEAYSNNEIRFLPIKDFPSLLLGKLAAGFDQCFYISYRNYIIFSNELQELKKLIRDINEENTWGKSIQMNNFFAKTNHTANVNLYVNIPRSWNLIMDHIHDTWKPFFTENSKYFKSIELASFQYSVIDDSYFTNYTFSQPIKRTRSIPKTNPDNGVRFVHPLVTKPFLVRTHAHQGLDILVQDSSHTVYYLNENQNAIWTVDLEEKIISDVHLIDYYKNGKIQYLLATRGEVHILDRTGAYIPGFPKKLPNQKQVDQLNLIDYDLNRSYRIAITDTEGSIYLADKNLRLLEGWNPKIFRRQAIQPLIHQRFGRRDVMVSVQENGVIHVMNRRSRLMPGFPFDIKSNLSQQYFVRPSNSLSNSSLTLLTLTGELVEVTFEGEIVKREQLIKSSEDSQFELIPDRKGNDFILVRKDKGTYDVLDGTGNLLFKKEYLSDQVLTQYYRFGAGKDLIVFTDQATRALYIYNKEGDLLTGNPINSAHEISLLYSEANRQFEAYTTWGENLEVYTFSD